MPRLRISMASLLGIIAVIALGLAGIKSASSFWTTAAATVTLALLLGALLAAWLLAGADRAFWAGFALFGWTYLVLVNWDWVGGQFGHDLTAGLSDLAESMFAEPVPIVPAAPVAPPLPTLPLNRPYQPPTVVNPAPRPAPPGPSYLEEVRQRQIKIGNFVQIGRLTLALSFGLLGGFIATVFARRRESTAKLPAASTLPPGERGGG
jgi:hypothetical protein